MELHETDFPPANFGAPVPAGTHHLLEVAPPGRNDLAFRLALPVSWACDPASVSAPGDGSAWTPLAVFGDKAATRLALVTVLWRKLDIEVPFDEWIAYQMGVLKVDIVAARIGQDAHGLVVDIGGTCVGVIRPPGAAPAAGDPQMKSAVRAMARCDGPDIFLVWGMAARETYAPVASDFALAGATFQLKREPSRAGMEPIQQAAATDPTFTVAAPASWTHQPVPDNLRKPGKSALNLILAPSGSLDGLIRVKAIDTCAVTGLSGPQLVHDATEELLEAGVQLTADWQPMADPVILATPDLEAAFVTGGAVQNAAYEIHFGIVQRPPLIFCVTAVIVALATDPIAALRGRRAYKIALASAHPA